MTQENYSLGFSSIIAPAASATLSRSSKPACQKRHPPWACWWEMPQGVLSQHKLTGKATADMMDAHGFGNWKKKKDLNIYKGDKEDWRKSRQEENETQITFLNNRNLQKTFSSAKLWFSFIFLLTTTMRKYLGVKSNKSQPCCVSEAIFSLATRISLAVLPATGQFPLQFSLYS